MITRKKVIFTGQSGTGKAELIEELATLSRKRGRTVLTFHVGQLMYERVKVNAGKILSLPLDRLESLRNEVFRDVFDAAANNPGSDTFVDTHATFRWENGLFPAFAVDEIRKFEADMCITVVADVDQVKLGLSNSDFPYKQSLRDIIVWREEEMLASELMADLTDCDRYIVPKQMTKYALFRLIFDPQVLKIYLSYPISSKQPDPVAAAIELFRKRFRSLNTTVVFDPLEITAEPLLMSKIRKLRRRNSRKRTVSVETLGQRVALDVHEVEDIQEYIPGQARAFDYRLIEQSDAILAFVPVHEGQPFRADGIVFEMAYAGYKGKASYLVWPAEEEPSLMFDLDNRFRSITEARSFFNKKKS